MKSDFQAKHSELNLRRCGEYLLSTSFQDTFRVNSRILRLCKIGSSLVWKQALISNITTSGYYCRLVDDGTTLFSQLVDIRPIDFDTSSSVDFLKHHIRWRSDKLTLLECIDTLRVDLKVVVSKLLLPAVVVGNVEALVVLLIEKSLLCDSSTIDGKGRNCMQIAIMNNYLPCVAVLCHQKANVDLGSLFNQPDAKGMNIFHYFALYATIDTIKYCLGQNIRFMEVLGEAAGGALINRKDHLGRTALDYATLLKKSDVAHLLNQFTLSARLVMSLKHACFTRNNRKYVSVESAVFFRTTVDEHAIKLTPSVYNPLLEYALSDFIYELAAGSRFSEIFACYL